MKTYENRTKKLLVGFNGCNFITNTTTLNKLVLLF